MISDYRGCRVLVAGGLGFIGSALTAALVERQARVRVLDSLVPHCGGSPRNIREVAARVEVLVEDTRDRDAVNRAVEGVDVVFHLASPAEPHGTDFYADLDIACLGTWHLLEAVRLFAPGARAVFTSSHHVYAPECASPVAEDAPVEPDTLFGVHKLAGERYWGLFRRAYGLDLVVARLTSVFGPRQRLRNAGYGSLARVLDSALHGEEIRVLHAGGWRGDYLYVADAVEALLGLGLAPSACGLTVNVGSGEGQPLHRVVETVIAEVGRGRVSDYRLDHREEGPSSRDFVADVSRLRVLGLPSPRWSFEDAVRATVAWYRGDAA